MSGKQLAAVAAPPLLAAFGGAGIMAATAPMMATAGAGAAAAAPAFADGSRIQQMVETTKGTFELVAKVGVEGKNLALRSVSWFHVTEEGRVPLGATEQRSLISQLAQQAKAAGFDRLMIEGAKWGADKIRNFNIDLTRLK